MKIRELIEMLEAEEARGVENVAVYNGGIIGGSDPGMKLLDNSEQPGQTLYLYDTGKNVVWADRD